MEASLADGAAEVGAVDEASVAAASSEEHLAAGEALLQMAPPRILEDCEDGAAQACLVASAAGDAGSPGEVAAAVVGLRKPVAAEVPAAEAAAAAAAAAPDIPGRGCGDEPSAAGAAYPWGCLGPGSWARAPAAAGPFATAAAASARAEATGSPCYYYHSARG